MAHAAGAERRVATPRIHKPGQSEVFAQLARARPDGFLVRNLAGLAFFRQRDLPTVADFSLNAANELTVHWLHARGARRVTPAYDLSRRRLMDLTAAVPPEWLEVVVHRHTPMFHAEYCLFCGIFHGGRAAAIAAALADGTGCGSAIGWAWSIWCWPTANAATRCFMPRPRILPKLCRALHERGVRHFRVELLAENTAEQVRRLLAGYPSLVGNS